VAPAKHHLSLERDAQRATAQHAPPRNTRHRASSDGVGACNM